AGSVIIGMHHDQDIRNMGGLRKYMKITWITSLLGSLALIGTPFFSGFYSKDSIIEAVMLSHLPGSGFAKFAVLAGVFVTAFYSFRMYFLVFHGKENFGHAHDAHGHDDHHDDHHHGLAPGQKPHESPAVVWVPLVLLAIPSVLIGLYAVEPMLYGDFFKGVIFIDAAAHPAMSELKEHFHGWQAMGVHSLQTAPFWLAVAGVALSYYFYMVKPSIPTMIKQKFSAVYTLLDNKYYMDKFNEVVFAGGARLLGGGLWNIGDKGLIDGLVVNGSAKLVGLFSKLVRLVQTGFIYHYALVMILGVLGFLIYFMPLPFAK
ncbi:proton-conducting transporter membrane subunit, partial [Undibacterium sp.]|uniref:proton-conducting transporter transmembrane domain-containing protein n=1 Tax=Undibacterium sp. TaxID=1914977 RepID=UPI003751534E